MIMELKVWVDGIQRVVCGATLDTTCQDVVIALAHAMGRTGRFTLIEKWRDVDRPLTPSECPLRVLYKWGEYAAEVRFILCQADAENQKPQDRDKLKKTGDQTHISHSLLPHQGGDASVKRSLTFSGVHNYSSGSQNFSLSSSQPTSKFRKTHLGAVPNGDILSGPSLPQNSRQAPSPRPLKNSNSNGVSNVQINPLVHATTGTLNSTGGSMHKGVKASAPSPQPHPVPHPRHKRASPALLQDNIPSGGVNAPLASSTQLSSALPLSHQRGLHNSRVPTVQPVIPQPHPLPLTQPHPHLNPQSIPSSHRQQQSAGPHLGEKNLHHPGVAPHPAHRDVQHPGVPPHPAQRDVQHPGAAIHPAQRDQQHLGASAQPAQRNLQYLGGTVHPAVRGDHSLPNSRESTPPPLPTSLPPDAGPFPSHIARLSHNSLDPAPDPKQALAAVEVSLGSASHSRQASLEIEEYDLDRNFPDMSRDSSHGERPSVSLEYRLDDGVTAGSGSGGQMEGEHAKLVRLVNMQQERLKTQESQISMINTEITAMEEREKEYEEQLQAIMEELLLQENRQHELEPQLSDLERVEWENVLDGEKKCELDLSRQIEACKTKLAELEQKLEQTRKREADLRAEINSEEERLTGERQRLEAEETKAAEEVSKLKEEIQKLQNQSAELEKTISEGQTSLFGIEGDLQVSEAQMAEQTAQLEEIEKELKAENMKDFATNPVPKENPQPKESGETILKILEGRLSPRPPSRGPESPTSPPFISALAAKTQSGVWV